MRLEIAAIVVDGALRGFREIVESGCFDRPRMLSDNLIKEPDRVVQIELTNFLQVAFSSSSKKLLGLLHQVICLFRAFRVRLSTSKRLGLLKSFSSLVEALIGNLGLHLLQALDRLFGLLLDS